MNNIHLFPSDTYGVMVVYSKELGYIANRSETTAYEVICVTNPRQLEVPVPLSISDLANSKCHECPHNERNIKARLRKEYESLTREEREANPYCMTWVTQRYTNLWNLWRDDGIRMEDYPTPCSAGFTAIKEGQCHVHKWEDFQEEAAKYKVKMGLATLNLPHLALIQTVTQKPSGTLSVHSAGKRRHWKMYGFSEYLPEGIKEAKEIEYKQQYKAWKANGANPANKPSAVHRSRGIWLAPYTMANVYEDATICWGQVKGLNKFKTHRSVFSNFFGNIFNSDLSSNFQKSIKYTLENFDVKATGNWKLAQPTAGDRKIISTAEQYDGMFITDRPWLLEVVPRRYHIKLAGKRLVIGWFRKTDSKKHIWVNCNGYVVLMASLKNKCTPIPLGPLSKLCKTS